MDILHIFALYSRVLEETNVSTSNISVGGGRGRQTDDKEIPFQGRQLKSKVTIFYKISIILACVV